MALTPAQQVYYDFAKYAKMESGYDKEVIGPVLEEISSEILA